MENDILRMELPVGSEFVINNDKFICSENIHNSCMDCDLNEHKYDMCCDALHCTAEKRIDGKDVSFKKIVL